MEKAVELIVGDTVEIIVYGEIGYLTNEEGGLDAIDVMPSLVGQKGIIDKIVGNKYPKYYIKGIIGKYGIFNKEQLKKI